MYQDIFHLQGSCEDTINDSAFSRHPCLLKVYPEKIQIAQQHHFNKKLFSALVVTENSYGMLKGP